ncbi:hypothetical protein, partial [Faecalibaculum rodentium]
DSSIALLLALFMRDKPLTELGSLSRKVMSLSGVNFRFRVKFATGSRQYGAVFSHTKDRAE